MKQSTAKSANYAQAALDGEVARVSAASEGERNGVLNSSAINLGAFVREGLLDRRDVEAGLEQAAHANGSVHGNPQSLHAARATIRSGLDSGIQKNTRVLASNDNVPGQSRQPSAEGPMPRDIAVPWNKVEEPAELPAWSLPGADGKPRFHSWGDDGPPARDNEIRRHAYKRGGVIVRIKVKNSVQTDQDRQWVDWYHVRRDDGEIGWQARKPAGYRSVPYVGRVDPLGCAIIGWPEGEKDCDSIDALDIDIGTITWGGTGSLPQNCERWFLGEHVVIFSDNHEAGRKHAERKAALCEPIALSVKIVDFPDTKPGGDVTDWIEDGHTKEELVARIDATSLWAPAPAAASEPTEEVSTDTEIKGLANLSPIEYERERKPAAARLGITRLGVLDDAVKAARSNDGAAGEQGRAFEIADTELWPDPVDAAELLNDLVSAIGRYVVLPGGASEIVALWAVHTYCFDCFMISPRLAITSPEKGCGKTTLLDVLTSLVARALPTSNATTAAIFRIVETTRPTLLIDEADTFLKDNEEMRGILNSGHRKGGSVIRTVGENHEARQFSTWAPSAIAMIGRLPDTLDDRSVNISLRRRKPIERVESFRSDRTEHLNVLARKMARWTTDHDMQLRASDPEMGDLQNRVADNWRPLLAIADIAGGEWPTRAREIAVVVTAARSEQSIRLQLLADIRVAFRTRGTDRLSSEDLIDHLIELDDRPWSEWKGGRALSKAGLARLLNPFNITPATIRLASDITKKGYTLAAFEDAFSSYLPPDTVTTSQLHSRSGSSTCSNVTETEDVTLAEAQQPYSRRRCDGVTAPKDQMADEDIFPSEVIPSPHSVPEDPRPALGPQGDSQDDFPDPNRPGLAPHSEIVI